MVSFVIATLITPNFMFEAAATTKAESEELLESAWSRHFSEYGNQDMLSWDYILEDIQRPDSRFTLSFKVLEVGAAYRDGEKLVSAVLT
jgi:hypothetical protein